MNEFIHGNLVLFIVIEVVETENTKLKTTHRNLQAKT